MTDQPDTYYTVQPNDTFYSLSQLCYQDGDKWQLIRQANPALEDVDQDQPLDVGFQLTLPFFPELTTILTTNEGDTLQTLAKSYYDDENQWMRIGTINPALQGVGPDQPLPAGQKLAFHRNPIPFRLIITGSNSTFISLATTFYHNANRWPVIRQANRYLQQYQSNQILPAGIAVTIP